VHDGPGKKKCQPDAGNLYSIGKFIRVIPEHKPSLTRRNEATKECTIHYDGWLPLAVPICTPSGPVNVAAYEKVPSMTSDVKGRRIVAIFADGDHSTRQ